MPVVSNSCKLVGKLVENFRYHDEEDKPSWPRSVVLAMPGKGRFELSYTDFPGMTFQRAIYQKFKTGNIRLLQLKNRRAYSCKDS